MTGRTGRTAQQWGGIALGVTLVLIGVTFLGVNPVFVVAGALIAVGHAVWLVRTSRRRSPR